MEDLYNSVKQYFPNDLFGCYIIKHGVGQKKQFKEQDQSNGF